MSVIRRLCAGPCGRNRDVRFFPPDARRSDGLSTVCVTCRRKKRSTGSRNQRLQETYGITEAEYQAILESQQGGCAICGGKRKGSLDVDHCHRTGLIRGLCCRRCNRRLLPAAQDSVARLLAAISYLEDSPAQYVIGRRVVPNGR